MFCHDSLRRQMLLTRLDATIQSFTWSERMKGREGEIGDMYRYCTVLYCTVLYCTCTGVQGRQGETAGHARCGDTRPPGRPGGRGCDREGVQLAQQTEHQDQPQQGPDRSRARQRRPDGVNDCTATGDAELAAETTRSGQGRERSRQRRSSWPTTTSGRRWGTWQWSCSGGWMGWRRWWRL